MRVTSPGRLPGIQQCSTTRNSLSLPKMDRWNILRLPTNRENLQTILLILRLK
jgi:hypothetical protein